MNAVATAREKKVLLPTVAIWAVKMMSHEVLPYTLSLSRSLPVCLSWDVVPRDLLRPCEVLTSDEALALPKKQETLHWHLQSLPSLAHNLPESHAPSRCLV